MQESPAPGVAFAISKTSRYLEVDEHTAVEKILSLMKEEIDERIGCITHFDTIGDTGGKIRIFDPDSGHNEGGGFSYHVDGPLAGITMVYLLPSSLPARPTIVAETTEQTALYSYPWMREDGVFNNADFASHMNERFAPDSDEFPDAAILKSVPVEAGGKRLKDGSFICEGDTLIVMTSNLLHTAPNAMTPRAVATLVIPHDEDVVKVFSNLATAYCNGDISVGKPILMSREWLEGT